MSIDRAIELLRPHKIKNYDTIRIGPNEDGGYIMVNDFDGIAFAISGGIGHDDLWEQHITRKIFIPVDAYDIEDNGWTDTPYRLFSTGLYGYPEKNYSSLDEKLRKYKENQIIAKIDIEGSEWDLLQYTSDDTLKKIRHMVLELHLNDDITMLEKKALTVLEKLYKMFRVVHIHGNNWGKVHKYEGLNIPDVMEVTFANINYYDMEPSNKTFPNELDVPNDPRKKDIHLGTFTLKGAIDMNTENSEWKSGYEEGFAAGWKAAKEGNDMKYKNYPPVYYGDNMLENNSINAIDICGTNITTVTESKTIHNITDHTRIV